MKKTVWEIDGDTRLEYCHGTGEILFIQDSTHAYGGKVREVSMDEEMVSDLMIALGELKVLLDAEKISTLEKEVA